MKVCWEGFAGSNHSWAIVAQNICRNLIANGHDAHIKSTNGFDFFPEDLKPHIREKLDNDYDLELTYTAMKNFGLYLSHGSKNKFGIWCYEFNAASNPIPDGFAKHHRYCDLVLPPSNFAKQIFLNSGIPDNKMRVIPHGIDFNLVNDAKPFKLKTKKSTKILVVIAQIHRRKNLAGMLAMYGTAFDKKDDVCLVLKIQDRPSKQPFELDFKIVFNEFLKKFPNHGEIEIIREFVPNIYSLYKSCDIVLGASHCEGFGITALDAHALGKINIASRYGGFLDFLNDNNSLLVDGKEFTVPPNFLYWSSKTGLKAFMPDIDSGVTKLRYAVSNKDILLTKYHKNIEFVKNNYNWNTITNQIIGLCK